MTADPERATFCPVCRARFRGAARCTRCGADLTALMLLLAHAYRLRQNARRLLRRGDSQKALTCIEDAQRLHATPQGNLLRWICATASKQPSSAYKGIKIFRGKN